MAQWSGDAAACIEHHVTAVKQARGAGNTACEVMSLCMAAFVKARMRDLDGARELVEEAAQTGQKAMQPTLMGYIHYARGGIAQDSSQAIDEYQTSVEWANMAGNHLGGRPVKQLIADLEAAQAATIEALAIHMRTLIDLPSHGAAFYNWLTIRSLILPLVQLEADEYLAVLTGALKDSPLKLDKVVRDAVEKGRARLGDSVFELAAARGSRFNLAETRRYIIDAWRGIGTG